MSTDATYCHRQGKCVDPVKERRTERDVCSHSSASVKGGGDKALLQLQKHREGQLNFAFPVSFACQIGYYVTLLLRHT
jgi:hypothetical protein